MSQCRLLHPSIQQCLLAAFTLLQSPTNFRQLGDEGGYFTIQRGRDLYQRNERGRLLPVLDLLHMRAINRDAVGQALLSNAFGRPHFPYPLPQQLRRRLRSRRQAPVTWLTLPSHEIVDPTFWAVLPAYACADERQNRGLFMHPDQMLGRSYHPQWTGEGFVRRVGLLKE